MHVFLQFVLVIFGLHGLAFAQGFDAYEPLRSQGPIPTDFTTSSSLKYERAKEQLNDPEEGTNTKQTKHDFLLESNFLIDQVLASGRVLFNDPVSVYLGQILDTLLVNEPELRAKVRVYAVRSSIVNSFTTDDGIILVNLGLVAQLENEAQLAFILCHELAHFTQHHVLNAYLQNEELKNGEGGFKRGSFDETLLAKSRYSKDLEKEADKLGWERLSATSYSSASLLNVFEMMRYAHLPFDDIPFDKNFFDREYYHIDDSYYLDRVRPVESSESSESNSDTHPSPTERQQLMSLYLSRETSVSGKDDLVSASEFLRLRDVCRFELSSLYLKADRPIISIYNSFLLLRSYPENFYLKKKIAQSLYALSKFKTAGNFGQIHPGYSQIEGESQQLYHLFYQLKPEELCVLAIGHLWKLKQAFPDDVDLDNMSHDLLQDLMKKYYVPGQFARTKPSEGWDEPDTTGIQSKYDRLKEKSKSNPKLSMVTNALVDLFDDAEFSELFDELELKEWGAAKETVSLKDIAKANREEVRNWRNHGFALGAKKVVMVSPTYAKLDLRKKQKHRFLHSESAKNKLIGQMRKSAELLKLDVEMLDISELDSNQVQQFNDIAFLNEWVDQRFVHLDVSMINQPTEKIEQLIGRYGTEYFTWTGIISYRETKPLMYFYLLYALIPPAIPLAVYYLARPNFDTYYYCISFDIRTGEPVQVNYNNYRRRDARDLMNSSIYDSLWQMKQPAKN